jgi:hypothetical protein
MYRYMRELGMLENPKESGGTNNTGNHQGQPENGKYKENKELQQVIVASGQCVMVTFVSAGGYRGQLILQVSEGGEVSNVWAGNGWKVVMNGWSDARETNKREGVAS